jgi:hypothetical protein
MENVVVLSEHLSSRTGDNHEISHLTEKLASEPKRCGFPSKE